MPYNAATSRPVDSPDEDTNTYFYDTSQGKFFTAAGSEVTDSEKITDLSFINFIRPPSGNAVATNPEPIQTIPYSSNPTNTTFSDVNLKYPIDNKDSDYIEFKVAELNTSTGVVASLYNENGGTLASLANPYGNNANRREFSVLTEKGSVSLSIQGPISDQHAVAWGPNSVDFVQAAMYRAAMNAQNVEGIAEGIQKGIESLGTDLGATLKSIMGDGTHKSLFAAMAAGNPGIYNRATGQALNPNLELLFTGPELRPFTFQFLLSAYSREEAKTIRSIIRFFKLNMAPRIGDNGGSGLFLKSPYVFYLTYKNGKTNTEHQSIGRATSDKGQKACALKNFSTDYTPLGSYMTYDDGEENPMVAYRLTMNFEEIVPIYDVDYVNEHPIGY